MPALHFAENQERESLPQLVSQLSSARQVEAKEHVLNLITTNFPNAGPDLLALAKRTTDVNTKWMAIRGIGNLKYKAAAPFLIESLHSKDPYVRANAARALGDMKAYSAETALISLLGRELDSGVIEQTSLALWMIRARKSVPVLKSKISNPSIQTRVWILQAIGILGSKDDVPFLAEELYGQHPAVSMSAAQAIERIMGVDFGLPKGNGPHSPEEGLENARRWWEAHKSDWGPKSKRELVKK
jgi:HEAT repeat protein